MAKLRINELKTAGSELFEDSETFLDELNNDELVNALGGFGYFSPNGGFITGRVQIDRRTTRTIIGGDILTTRIPTVRTRTPVTL
ncbi:hypothetical protein Cylst_2275 [Cylindrospermum stagnale PCC 7417]|uniref:Uncharacterized protein n=1 Tax=Cylindrospermum stagnale PCC 7417 TaxID=56107 RepID=K9WVU9_9NOST|nr:hypothetical protein [Cylindrospermum stagnale]AFZ24505.1 hypothetical protein Cylst_2275 [Cylindrospermum stagnale PCC 7417]